MWTPQRYGLTLTPGTVNVTFFGKRVFEDIIKLRVLRSSRIKVGPKSNDQGLYKRREVFCVFLDSISLLSTYQSQGQTIGQSIYLSPLQVILPGTLLSGADGLSKSELPPTFLFLTYQANIAPAPSHPRTRYQQLETTPIAQSLLELFKLAILFFFF